MAENSAIEWTDHTFNPWIGCTKVSPGCDHCYAEAQMDKRLHVVSWGAGAPRKRTSIENWLTPIAWQRNATAWQAQHGRRQRVFCSSLADVFDNEVPGDWRDSLFELIERTPDLDWLLLTKRIGNVPYMVWPRWMQVGFPGNVWLGATVVNQAEANRDIPKLLQAPAAVHFLSIEPLLGPIDLEHGQHGHQPRLIQRGIDWVIVGGETGRGARPMQADWARQLRDQCQAGGAAFFFKQWGDWLPAGQDGNPQIEPATINASDQPIHVGKKVAGRLLDGRTHDDVPGQN